MASSEERLPTAKTSPPGRPGHYVRQASDYVRPAFPLRLDGTASSDAATGWDNNPDILERVPTGAEIVVEAVAEPGNPHDHTAVALDVDGMRVGYLRRWVSESLFPAIAEANKAGFYVLMQAKKLPALPGRQLEVRAAYGADLRAWLRLPPHIRGTEFLEFDWIKADYQVFYQDQLSAAMGGANESELFECEFVAGSRKDDPYRRARPARAPKPPEEGTYADVFVAGIHVGELRRSSRYHSSEEVYRIYGGQKTGLARFRRWPDNIELKVLVPLADGTWPPSNQPFLWRH